MAASVASLQAGIKTLYPQKTIEETYFAASPTFAAIPKSSDWEGMPMHIALALGGTPGSHTFSTAQSVSGQVTNVGFDITNARDYNVIRISTEAMRVTKSNVGSLLRGVKQQADGALYTQKKTLGIDLFGSGSGSRGRIASGADGPTLTLTDPTDIYKFEIGDVLVSNDVDSGVGVSTNTGIVGGIDYNAGTLTVAGGGNWHGDFDTNDYLFRSGDAGLSMSGFEAWNPTTAPSATTFYGLDRTQSSKLSGVRYDYTVAADGTMERYLINLLTRVCWLGGDPRLIVMNTIRWGNFENELGDKCRYDRVVGKHLDGSESSIGFDTITIMGPKGKVNVMADPYCPYNRVRALDLDHWKFCTIGPMGWIDDDGKGQWLREGSADSHEARLGWYGQLYSDFPGASGVGSIANLAA